MKKFLVIMIVTIFSAMALGLGACGSSSSGDCADVCAKVGECGESGDEQECLGDCPDMINIIRSSAWSNAVSCIMDTPCGPNFSPDGCLMQAGQSEPDSNIDSLATTLCTKANECDSNTEIAQCKTDMLADPDTALFKIFKSSLLDCTGTCVSGNNCTDIGTDIESVIAQCACACDILMLCD